MHYKGPMAGPGRPAAAHADVVLETQRCGEPRVRYHRTVRLLEASLLVLLSFVASCATRGAVDPVPVTGGATESITLAGYVFHYPEWWQDEEVPAMPASASSYDAVEDFIVQHFGADTGTSGTWRGAMKVWVAWYARSGELPVYIGHAYLTGGEFDAAAQAFAELHALSETQGDLAEWYDCYLAYSAGVAYTGASQYDEARRWYRVAALHQSSGDEAVRYYASISAGRMDLDDEALVAALAE